MKIESVTEANSMQPNTWSVCDEKFDYAYKDLIKHGHNEKCIARIEKVQIGQCESFYVAYDFKNRKIFEWQSKSVNVKFYYPEE